MKLTVLGKYGPYPNGGGACSGYLLEAKGTRLVLDFGNGTLSRLLELSSIEGINAVFLSHLHSDHMSDMLILRYALQQLQARGDDVPMPLSVIAPNDPEMEFRQLASFGVYDMIPAMNGMRFRFGELSVTLRRMIHPVTCYGMDIFDGDRRLFYTGDTGYFEELPGLCEGANMLLADAGMLDREKTTRIAPHLTAREAGELARDAHVDSLVCTHIWSGYTDAEVQSEACQAFPMASVAIERQVYEI